MGWSGGVFGTWGSKPIRSANLCRNLYKLYGFKNKKTCLAKQQAGHECLWFPGLFLVRASFGGAAGSCFSAFFGVRTWGGG